MSSQQTIIIISKDAALVSAAHTALSSEENYRLILCTSENEGNKRLNSVQTHLIICDSDVIADPRSNILSTARTINPNAVRILISPAHDHECGAQIALHSAAYMFLAKPIFAEQFQLIVKRALEFSELSQRYRKLSRELKVSVDDEIFEESEQSVLRVGVSQFEQLVYSSPNMEELVKSAKLAAKTEMPVLISGETGTGKELLAGAIHYNSSRKQFPMHVQNCGGISDDALHSELFGHVKGSFSGAISDRLGLFRAADGGTVFLDEISEISPKFQAHLLRFLQEGEVKPLGSDTMHFANVRIIAASNRSIEEMVADGSFRKDLFYRLKGFQFEIPPLRDRPDDISILTQFFIEKYAGVFGRRVLGVTKEALAKLEAYTFPGNVRELETEVQRMIATADRGGYISNRHLSSTFEYVQPQTMAMFEDLPIENKPLKDIIEDLESRIVELVLQRNKWNQSRSAIELGLSRVGLSNKIKRYGLMESS